MKKITTTLTAFFSILFISIAFGQQGKKDITLKDIWQKGDFYPDYVYGLRSMNDGVHYTSLAYVKREDCIVEYSYKTGKAVDTILCSGSLIPNGQKEPIFIRSYAFSNDENKILIATKTDHIYRHSTRSVYYIWNRKTKKLQILSGGDKQMYATFSPDGSKVAFVRDNNIFVKDLNSGFITQITFDGKKNNIINGATDWVYEEEFSFARAFFWSPDSKRIAFYRFDESKVPEYTMIEYKHKLYPSLYKYKYPKAGEPNSKVLIYIYDLQKKNTVNVDIGKDTDQYIPRIKWTQDPNTLSVQRMDRLQNKLELLLANAETGVSKVIMTETNKDYIEISDDLTFLKDKKHFIWSSETDGYNHLYLYDMTGKMVNKITSGNWDVTDFLGVNEKTKDVYYLSATVSPIDRDLYVTNLDGKHTKKLSTGIEGTHDVEFSKSFDYYIDFFSDANTPYVITLHEAPSGKLIRTLEDNAALRDSLKQYSMSKKTFFQFKDSAGVSLNAWMIKPTHFDSTKKYPVLMNVYGGPGINTVNNAWEGNDYMWYQMLAEKGYIIVSVDNRGTGARGNAFKQCTYGQLGKLETEDQIDAAKYLGTLAYVDKTRVGIWGWSYGGYMSSLCITKGAKYFKSAIAVAPVVNWRYYDTIYTERYMGLPKDNPHGYDDNSPVHFANMLKGHYLLIQGTADDNVHFQNSIAMIQALEKANKQFDLMIYPDKNHSIYGGNTRLNLYTKMTDFIFKDL